MPTRRAILTVAGGAGLVTSMRDSGIIRSATAESTASDAPSVELPISSTPATLSRVSDAGDVGFSSERLGHITAWMREVVERGRVPGAVMAVGCKGGLAYLEAVGYRDREAGAPMPVDAVFSLASMTKPIVSLALMISNLLWVRSKR